MLLIFLGVKNMETLNVIGSFSGIASIIGMLWGLIKIGVWKGKIEEKTDSLVIRGNKSDKEAASLVLMQHQQNITLTKLETKFDTFESKLDILLDKKTKGVKKSGY